MKNSKKSEWLGFFGVVIGTVIYHIVKNNVEIRPIEIDKETLFGYRKRHH